MKTDALKRNIRLYARMERARAWAEEAQEEFERSLPKAIDAAFTFHEAAEELGLDEATLLSVADEVGSLEEALRAFELAARIKRGERVIGNGDEDTFSLDTMARLYQPGAPEQPLVLAVARAIKNGF